MRRVVIIHQWMAGPDGDWRPWLTRELKEKSYEVICPEMPGMDTPVIGKWVGKLAEIVRPDRETVLVGHSIGCQAILRYLETLPEKTKVRGIVLVAPWMKLDMKTLEEEGEGEEVMKIARPWIETPIDFLKVRVHTGNVTAIFSDNDYYVPIQQKDLFESELGAKIVVEHEKGHFTEDDGVTELPSVLAAVESLFL